MVANAYWRTASTLKRMALLLPAFLLLAGCDTLRSQFGYLVVKQQSSLESPVSEPSCHYNQCEVLRFTVYRGNTIEADCQAFDAENHCHSLRVGETYNLKRSDMLGFLTLKEPSVVLSIDKEYRD
jgi:hypothetical protein